MRAAYLVNQAVGTAGWGRYAVELIRHIQPMGVEPVLITASAEVDPTLQGIEQHTILPDVFKKRFEMPRSLFYAPHLRQILKTCDVAQCVAELYAPLAALAAPREMPFLLNAHGTWAIRPLENWRQRLFFAPAVRRADQVICLSRFTHQWMSRLIELPKAVVLTGGVTVADYQRTVEVRLPEWVGKVPVVLNTAGAFKTRKGQDVAIEAAALAREQLPGLRMVFTGRFDPENSLYAAQIQKRIHELNLQDNVYFAGLVSQDELVAWYQQADILLHLPVNDGSSFEGLGLIYLEAAAAGTPSIGSQNCGAEDAVVDGETGFTVPQNDPQAAADALVKLFQDQPLRTRMGAAAMQLAQRLSWENLAAKTLNLYQQLLSD